MFDLIIELATNKFYLILLLIFLLVLFHWLFIRIYKFDKVKFKKIEYFYLSAALIGIIGMSANLRIWWASNELLYSKQYAYSAYGWVRDRAYGYYCMKFNRSSWSPDNFDEIVKKHDEVCEWFKNVSETIPKTVKDLEESDEDPPDIRFSSLPKISINDEFLITELSRFKAIIEDYRRIRQSYFDLKEETNKTTFEGFLLIFSPILICIALALRFTKVTGEIKIEKANQANSVDAKSRAAD